MAVIAAELACLCAAWAEEDTIKSVTSAQFAAALAYEGANAVGPSPKVVRPRLKGVTTRELMTELEKRQAALTGVRFDLMRLRAMAKEWKWHDRTPVNAEALGPLLPFTAPKGVMSKAARMAGSAPVMQVDIEVPPGMSEEQSKEFNRRVAKLYAAMSAMHASMGGTGLRILDEGSCDTVPAADEAPVDADLNPSLVSVGGGH